MNAAKLTYLYDGACSVCASEVDRLRRRDAAGRLSLSGRRTSVRSFALWPIVSSGASSTP